MNAPLLPASEEELAAHVRAAAAERRPVHTVGSRTKLHLGPSAPPDAIVIGTRALSRIVAYEPGDMVVTVQAGVRLADLQRTLAERRQWLPIDPPHAEATIGGLLATASAGPRRLGYGPPRDHVLGMRVVDASGVATKSGGQVVKNVTGFDLHKLHVGAMGTLGVISEVSMKIAAQPVVRAVFLVPCPDLATAHRSLLEVWSSPLRPIALDALGGSWAAPVAGSSSAAIALIGVEGPRSFVDRHVRELIPPRLPAPATRLEGDEAERVWLSLRDGATLQHDRIVVRIGARPQDLPGLIGELDAVAHADGAQVHAATGIARIALAKGVESSNAAALVRSWHGRAAARDGYALVESAPVDLAGRDALPWNPLRTDLLTSLKLRWDPERILNRGRMTL